MALRDLRRKNRFFLILTVILMRYNDVISTSRCIPLLIEIVILILLNIAVHVRLMRSLHDITSHDPGIVEK